MCETTVKATPRLCNVSEQITDKITSCVSMQNLWTVTLGNVKYRHVCRSLNNQGEKFSKQNKQRNIQGSSKLLAVA